jgi:Domain of unknown function (DUF4400)
MAAAGTSSTRIVWIVAFTAVLWLVLYSPAKTSAERYAEILVQEHGAYSDALGADVADRMLERLSHLQLIPRIEELTSAPQAADSGSPTDRVANRMAAVTHRFFAHKYFRSMDGLVALAAFRASALYELSVVVLVFLAIVIVDALAVRSARAAELRGLSAERFRLSELGAILLCALLFVACFLPMTVPPTVPTMALLGLTFAISRVVATYHRMI